MIGKLTDNELYGTTTVAGAVAIPACPPKIVMVIPPGPAGAVRVKVPVAEVPPITELGFTLIVETMPGVTVSDALLVEIPVAPAIVAVVFELTPFVLMVKVAVLAPDGTVTVPGATAQALLEVRVTTTPPDPALPDRVTVPVDVCPPGTVAGETEMLMIRVVTVRLAEETLVPIFPEIDAIAVVVTPSVVTVKEVEVCPGPTVTVAGTIALPLFEVSVTTSPSGPAGPASATVPVDGVSPGTDAGLRATDETPASFMVRTADWTPLPNVPEIVDVVVPDTAEVVTANAAVLAPAETVTLDGAVAAAVFVELSVTTVPPVGAGEVRVTVPVDEVAPVTELGASARPEIAGGLMVKLADREFVSDPARTSAEMGADIGYVVTVKVTDVCPAGIVTEEGTDSEALKTDKSIVSPPAGAAVGIVTVPVDGLPP